ncbi:hypothetical protein [Streptomyces sp. NPDC048111]|uniref:hypothetical protein n=1 Tax=Streptomyces sp. NPDC048111 TaxID=3365500 RepID=UPI00372029F3
MVTPPAVSGELTDEMAWARLYDLALSVAEEHGATIPESARAVGPYRFMQAITDMDNGLTLSWEGRKA